MTPTVRDRIARTLETLSDTHQYQVLDYVEFLAARHAEKPAAPVSPVQRVADTVEDVLRARGVAAPAIKSTVSALQGAMGVMTGVASGAVSVAEDVVAAARRGVTRATTAPAEAAAEAEPAQETPPPEAPTA